MHLWPTFLAVIVVAWGAAACGSRDEAHSPLPPDMAAQVPDEAVPSYLQRFHDWPDLNVREGNAIVHAPPGDVAVAKSYVHSAAKGALSATGERLTILTAKTTYAANEEIRVIHVYEATKPGVEVYVMGPKPVVGETIDGSLVTPAQAEPAAYDGAVLPSPNADFNYDITVYKLRPGRHTLRWTSKPIWNGVSLLTSNDLVLDVK